MSRNLSAVIAVAFVLFGGCFAQTAQTQPRLQPKAQKGRSTMKFILMMHMKTDPDSISKGAMNWPKKDVDAVIRFMKSFDARLKEAGELVSAEGLDWPNQAKTVRAGQDGEPVIDGVFPESKEFLIGYWIVDVDSPDRAYRIAAEASAAPGLGGAPLNMPIEVRQITPGPPE